MNNVKLRFLTESFAMFYSFSPQKILRAILLCLMFCANQASFSQELTAEHARAARAYAASQNLLGISQNLIQAFAAMTTRDLRKFGQNYAKEKGTLSEEGGRSYEKYLDSLMPPFETEYKAALSHLDWAKLEEDVALKIYAKYFSTAEMQTLTRFYTSTTGKKYTQVVAQKISDQGQDLPTLLTQHLTQNELLELKAFSDTGLPQKTQDTAAKYKPEMQAILLSHCNTLAKPLIQKYIALIKQRYQEYATPQSPRTQNE